VHSTGAGSKQSEKIALPPGSQLRRERFPRVNFF